MSKSSISMRLILQCVLLVSVVRYEVEVYTGSVENASTSANVFINICSADDGDTGRRALKKSLNNSAKFAVGQVYINCLFPTRVIL